MEKDVWPVNLFDAVEDTEALHQLVPQRVRHLFEQAIQSLVTPPSLNGWQHFPSTFVVSPLYRMSKRLQPLVL